MAPLFSSRDSSVGSGLLLVLRVLPHPLSPHVPYDLRRLPSSETLRVSALLQLRHGLHVVPLARILAIVPDSSHSIDDAGLLGGLRLQILDRVWFTRFGFPIVRRELSDGSRGL
uniref:Uncharacterized protein n=1 Tax=Noccaea caerulescens TaxID=107243 RepID=A0A1J3IYB0_NOCCA